MRSSHRLMVVLLAALAILLALVIDPIIVGGEETLHADQMAVGIVVVGAGLSRPHLRQWLSVEQEGEDEDGCPLSRIVFILLGLPFIVTGGTGFLDTPPTPELLIELASWIPLLLAAVAELVKSTRGNNARCDSPDG